MKKILLTLVYGILLALLGATLGDRGQSEHITLPDNPAAIAGELPTTEELTVCTQNLHRFGEIKGAKRKEQKNFLVERMIKAQCDLVAVQEVTGSTISESKAILSELTERLAQKSGRNFYALTGPSNDKFIRNAWLVDPQKVKVLSLRSLSKRQLPKLRDSMPAAHYSRGPLLLQGQFRTVSGLHNIALFNFHLKSKAHGYKDPYKSQYEHLRVQMAAGIFQEASAIMKKSPDTLVIVTGDRNAPDDSPTDMVLSGARPLSDFFYRGACRITQKAESVCRNDSPQDELNAPFVALLEEQIENGANIHPSGSYRFRGRYELLDEIYASDNRAIEAYAAGFEGDFGKGSDHLLAWSRLKLK